MKDDKTLENLLDLDGIKMVIDEKACMISTVIALLVLIMHMKLNMVPNGWLRQKERSIIGISMSMTMGDLIIM